MTDDPGLIQALEQAAGPGSVRTDPADLSLASADLYEAATAAPLAVVRPDSAESLGAAVAAATSRGCAVAPRGGGLSYTGGYLCGEAPWVSFDLSGLNRILDISEADMVVVAEAGATWKQLYLALRPRGLRLPFFGTFSGAGATIGGGLSHGALFFGSARYGSAADIVLALEAATADGSLLRTGQWALRNPATPVFRNLGPDLTGLLLHDGGAFGIKTKAALRLIRTPAETGYASFSFPELVDAAAALSEIARAGVAEEAYVLEAAAVAAGAERHRGAVAALRLAGTLVRSEKGALAAARTLAGAAVSAGARATEGSAFTLHCVAAGSSKGAVRADLAAARRIALSEGGRSIPATVPRLARADPFPNLDSVLDPDGARWAALNAKVAHSEAAALIDAHRRLVARRAEALAAHGVRITYLLSALGGCSFSFECIFHWRDAWLPMHSACVDPEVLQRLQPPPADEAARALVAALRQETTALFQERGAASNQLGRTYPYFEALRPESAALARGVKRLLDPAGLMNPGVLGL